MGFLVAGLVALAGLGTLALQYRHLRRLAAARDAAYRALTEALSARHALALHLVRICSGYLVLESPLLEAVALARYYAMQARTVLARTKTETDLCWALARLLLAAEDHAELATHPRLRAVVQQVADAEDRAAAARERYNQRADAYDLALQTPLGRLVARPAHLAPVHPFELDPTVAREAMMALMTPRRAPSGDTISKPVGPPASVAFSV